ncbi:putative TIM-barrel fold metal-dependent hydrolase [Rhodococcus sp. 27YEA15]|uniref:amidohydrolase family protein n=1 Tax=Rhodococcus sp. 27YEA15 TaxID=3156259 RepID=UPI003C7BB1FD
MAEDIEIVDFHVHYVNPAYPPTIWVPTTPELARANEKLVARLTDIEDVLSSDRDQVAVRVLNAPPAIVAPSGAPLPPETIRAINTHLGRQVQENPTRLRGLATIDAWQGEAAADEIRRAVEDLGLSGVVVDAATAGGDRLLDDPATFPVLRAAAELNVPVFVHPINPRGFTQQLAGLGLPGSLLARGAIDAASLLALLDSDVLDRLPELRLVLPLIGAPALLAGAFTELIEPITRHATPDARRHVYFDTMGFDPASIRYLIEVVGADHIVVGSDSPIVAEHVDRDAVIGSLRAAGLAGEDLVSVAGGTAHRLLGAAR